MAPSDDDDGPRGERLDVRFRLIVSPRWGCFSPGFPPPPCGTAAMGRAEVQIAMETMLRRLPPIELATDYPEWKETFVLRG